MILLAASIATFLPVLSRRVRKIPAKVRWWWARHVTYPWWSFQNFRKGYRWCSIQRCRRCDHTSPYHYPTCVNYMDGVL